MHSIFRQDDTYLRRSGSERRRSRTRIFLRLAASVLTCGLVLFSLVGQATAGSHLPSAVPSGTSSSTATYQAIQNVPAPPASHFAGASGGGDGWAVALSGTQLFNVFHHDPVLQVECHNQSDGSQCTGYPKTITQSGADFATSGQPSIWLDQATGRLYVFASRVTDQTGGVVCIDTTSSSSDPFCGFTALTAAGDAPIVPTYNLGNISDAVTVGDDWYAFNYVNGTPSGTQDKLLCFDLASLGPCPSQPFSVSLALGSSGQVNDDTFPEPSIASFGSQVIIPMVTTVQNELACFDADGGHTCNGSWPATTTAYDYPSPLLLEGAGAPFPMRSPSGETVGLCLPVSGSGFADPCFSLSGSAVATPPNLASVVSENTVFNGPAYVMGPRIYVPEGSFGPPPDYVACFDFSTDASCQNFPKSLGNNLSIVYTVNPDPYRPTCLWVNADNGTEQIQNFDAYTGESCGTGPIRILASSIVAPQATCTPTNWDSLQLVTPGRSSYGSATVTFDNSDGSPISSLAAQTLDSTGSVNLSGLGIAKQAALPQFLITIQNPPANLTEAVVKVTWTATYSPSCVVPGITVNRGYRLEGGDGGVFAFQTPYQGSVGLPSPPGLGLKLYNFVAMADTPDGYWLVQSNGGVFAFGGATFYGSLPKIGVAVNDIVGIVSTSDSRGYWLVARDGGVFSFGDAAFHGSCPSAGSGCQGVSDIVGAANPDSGGYWLVARDGGVFSFGDAAFHGSCPSAGSGCEGLSDVVGIASPDPGGYWLAGADGGVFTFGDAAFHGSCPSAGSGCQGVSDVVGIASPDPGGYWLAGADGGVFTFGDAPFLGSCPQSDSACDSLTRPIVAIGR